MTDERCSILYLLPCFSPSSYFLTDHLLARLLVAFLECSIFNYLANFKMVLEDNKYYLVAKCFRFADKVLTENGFAFYYIVVSNLRD